MRASLRLFKLRITLTIHSHGRLFNLCVEWICTNPGRGFESATPLYRGLLSLDTTISASNITYTPYTHTRTHITVKRWIALYNPHGVQRACTGYACGRVREGTGDAPLNLQHDLGQHPLTQSLDNGS